MKYFARVTTTCGVFALAVWVSVGAQTPQTQSSDQNRASGNELTVVGCLKSADDATGMSGSRSGSAGSTSGTTGSGTMTGQSTRSSGETAQYVLTDAEVRSGDPGRSEHSGMSSHSGASTSGSTAGSTSGSTAGSTSGSAYGQTGQTAKKWDEDTFQLIAASSSVNFEQHLNHQVEVRGTLDKSAKGSEQASGASSSASRDMPKGQRLRVTSLRMLSSTCS